MTQPLPSPTDGSIQRNLRWAATLTGVAAATVAGVGCGVLFSGHGAVFSIGVAAMLLVYSVALWVLVGQAWVGRTWTTGPLTAASVLHVLVAASLAQHSAWWLLAFAALAVVTAWFAVAARRQVERRASED